MNIMSAIKGFFDSLKKSTKVTVLSCGSFVVLTMLILAFFMMFPITPSERVMDNIGRENVSHGDGQESVQSGVPGVETTVSTTKATKAVTTSRVTSTRSRTSFTITITTGSGFMWNGRIPTGGIPGGNETTTTAAEPYSPYEDPTGGNNEQGVPGTTAVGPGGNIEPTTGGTNVEPVTGGNTDPGPGTGGEPEIPTPSVTPGNGGGDAGGGSSGGGDAGTW